MNKNLKESILELRKLGKTFNYIATELSCSKAAIWYHCNRNNLGGKGSPSTEEVEDFKKMYSEGKSIYEIEKNARWSRTTIQRYIVDRRVIQKVVTPSMAVVSWRKRRKRGLVDYKGGKCERCGYDKCIEAMHFHHKDPTQKDFTISGKSWSKERLKQEVDKCELLCANCHAEEHARLVSETGIT